MELVRSNKSLSGVLREQNLTVFSLFSKTAILDEDGFQRSMAMLRIAYKRQAELRNSLKKKVMSFMQQQRKIRGSPIEDLDDMVLYGPHLKRALLGGMPKSDEDDESNKKSSSRSRGSSSGLDDRTSSSSRSRR